MAAPITDINALAQYINDAIKTNGNGAITAQQLTDILSSTVGFVKNKADLGTDGKVLSTQLPVGAPPDQMIDDVASLI